MAGKKSKALISLSKKKFIPFLLTAFPAKKENKKNQEGERAKSKRSYGKGQGTMGVGVKWRVKMCCGGVCKYLKITVVTRHSHTPVRPKIYRASFIRAVDKRKYECNFNNLLPRIVLQTKLKRFLHKRTLI